MYHYDDEEDFFERDWFGRRRSTGYTSTNNRSRVVGKWTDRYNTMSEAFFGSNFSSYRKNPLSDVTAIARTMLSVITGKNSKDFTTSLTANLAGEKLNRVTTEQLLPVNLLLDKEKSEATKKATYDITPEKTDAFLGSTIEKAAMKAYQTRTEFGKTLSDLDTQNKNFSVETFLRGMLNTERTSKTLSDNFPGYSRFIKSFKTHSFENDYSKLNIDPDDPGAKLLDLAVKLVKFPSAITPEEIDESSEMIREFKKIFDKYNNEIPETYEECDKFAKEIARYIKLKEQDKDKDDSGEGEGEDEGDGTSGLAQAMAKAMNMDSSQEKSIDADVLSQMITDMNKAESDNKTEDAEKNIKYDDNAADIPSEVKFTEVNDNKTEYFRVLGDIDMGRTAALRNLFKRKSKDQKFVLKSMKSGRFDTNKLAEARQHVPTVYERIGEINTNKITVGILIDESGSMHGSSIKMAQQAAIMLNEVFGKQPDIDLFIYGHTADRHNHETEIFTYREPGKALNKFALGNVHAKSNNRDGHAIEAVGRRIRRFTSNQGIILVLSDGAPAAYNYHNGKRDTQERVKKVEKLGFQVVQVAINNYVPSEEMFSHFVKMTNIETLPRDMANYLSRKANVLIKETVML